MVDKVWIVAKEAELLAIKIEVIAMQTANSERDLPAESPAYDESHFQDKAEDARAILEEINRYR